MSCCVLNASSTVEEKWQFIDLINDTKAQSKLKIILKAALKR